MILASCQDCEVTAHRESLEQVLVHLIQNAVDASDPDSPVFLALTVDGLMARFEIVDPGCGMSAEFVRNRLFKPFVSSKPGCGFGIGAFEARELVRAMRGRLGSRIARGPRLPLQCPPAARFGIRAARYIQSVEPEARIMTDVKPKLLVVEDDAGLQAQLKGL